MDEKSEIKMIRGGNMDRKTEKMTNKKNKEETD